jgi:hypothetical protein
MYKSINKYDKNNLVYILKIFQKELLKQFDEKKLKEIEKKLVKIYNDDIIPIEFKKLIFIKDN